MLLAQGPLFGVALACLGAKLTIKTWIYVDGFNLYYGAVKNTPYRWLNVANLASLLLPSSHTVDKVKYFTAHVSGAADHDAPRRHERFRAP